MTNGLRYPMSCRCVTPPVPNRHHTVFPDSAANRLARLGVTPPVATPRYSACCDSAANRLSRLGVTPAKAGVQCVVHLTRGGKPVCWVRIRPLTGFDTFAGDVVDVVLDDVAFSGLAVEFFLRALV